MKTQIQVRNVPGSVHRRLKARAAAEGVSMSAYVRRLIERSLARPSRREVLDALARLPPVDPGVSAADLIREGRRARAGGA